MFLFESCVFFQRRNFFLLIMGLLLGFRCVPLLASRTLALRVFSYFFQHSICWILYQLYEHAGGHRLRMQGMPLSTDNPMFHSKTGAPVPIEQQVRSSVVSALIHIAHYSIIFLPALHDWDF